MIGRSWLQRSMHDCLKYTMTVYCVRPSDNA